MEAKLFHSLTNKPPLPIALSLPKPSSAAAATSRLIFSPTTTRRLPPLKLGPINGSTNEINQESDEAPQPQIRPPPETVEVRFRRRSKRRSRQQRDGDGDGDRQFAKAAAASAPPVKKKWEDMSIAEKALELYVGEKGALYWLNKFAYASIFIVIGGWIVFRFVGPSLNFYQLDSPPLAPDALFKGSP